MRLGKNMRHALTFAQAHDGWASYARDRATVDAIKRLAARGLVEIHPTVTRMFRLSQEG